MNMLLKTRRGKPNYSPTLNTIIMVENALKKMDDSIIKMSDLKRILPKKVNHYTLKKILEYLEESNKITVSMKGITWIHNDNPKLRNAIKKGIEL